MAEGDIDNLTMEQYLALTRRNQEPGMVKPKIAGNVNFEIKSQFMRELREDTFFGNKNDNAHEHVERVLDIVSLFNIPGVTHEGVMIHVFPITLTGATKRWTAKQLEEIHNFKQEGDETLYQAWERYNGLLYKCLAHDINSYQKVKIFYNGLGTMNRQLLDSQGPIPDMTPAQALTAIQTMADHSQKWHHGSSSRNIDSSSNTEGITTIRSSSLQRMSSQRGSEKYKGRYGSHDQPSSGERRPSLTEIINKYMEEAAKRHAEQDKWLRNFYQNTETNRENHDEIIQGLEMKVKTLTNEVEGGKNGGKFKECKAIFTNDGLPLYTHFYYYLKKIEYFSANSGTPRGKAKCMGKLELINMVIEMDDNTKCTPQGIVENLLVKINKFIFPVDFVILDMVEDVRMPINLGRLLIATAHVKVDIFRKSISLELGNEKVIFKMRSSFTTIIFESVRAIRSKISTRDDNLVNIDYDLSLYDSEANHLLDIDPNVFTYDIDEVYKITYQGKSCEMETKEETSMELLIGMSSTKNKVHWCEAILQVKEGEHSYWASCNPYKDKCNGGDLTNDEKKLYWKSTNDNERVDLAWE
ncbi:hypothetical protein Tco_0030993 [Tanacetum coccineum]